MIFEKVSHLIAKDFNVSVSSVSADTRLQEDLNVDSLDAVELVMSLEDAFGVKITDQEAANFKTVGEIVDFVSNKIN